MSTRWDVLGFGAVAVDDLVYVDRYPALGAKVRVRTRRRQGGGLTGTALVAAARLGARAACCGVFGEDELSRFAIQGLEQAGVDCTATLFRPDARPFHSIVIVVRSTAQRTILSSNAGVIERPLEEIGDELIASCRVLFVDHTVVEGGLRAAGLARARGIPVVGDFESDRDPRVFDLMRQVDHLIVGTAFAERVTGESEPGSMVRALSSADRACCVVTSGERGCWYSERGDDVRHFPAFQVRAVDTTGCGDVFHGAYAACITKGECVQRAIQVATASAGITATCEGGQAGIPNRAEIDRFIEAYGASWGLFPP